MQAKQGSQRQAVLSEYEKELVQLISRGYEGLREHGARQRLEDAGEDVEAQMASLEDTLVKFTQKVFAKFAAIRHPLAEMCGAADSAVAKPSESAADDDTLRQYFQASLSLEDNAENGCRARISRQAIRWEKGTRAVGSTDDFIAERRLLQRVGGHCLAGATQYRAGATACRFLGRTASWAPQRRVG